MNEKLLEILKKSKQVEARTNAQYGKVGGPKTKSGGGLFDDIPGVEENSYMGAQQSYITEQNEQNYEQAVKKSKLPPAIVEAMLKTPINHQQSVPKEFVDELRSIETAEPEYYNEDDEDVEFKKVQKSNKTNRHIPTPTGVSEDQIRVMIAQEISKALPKILENYFDKKIIKENTRLMKALLTNKNKI
jgi:hypothetical protein